MQAFMTPYIRQLRPIEGALLDNPNVSNYQNTKKHEHLGEPEQSELAVNDGPWEKENGFNVEDDKQNRHNVVADCVSLSRIRVRIDAAFVRRQFALTAS